MKSLLQRSIEGLRTIQLLPTVGALAQFGPLGITKTRRQLGRSVDLSPTAGGLGRNQNEQQATLVEAGVNSSDELGIGDALAQQCVVTCSVDYPDSNTSPATRIANVIGTLSWGGDGHSQDVEFDFRNGTLIRPVGSSFRVSARLALDALGNEPNQTVRVGAWIGYGSPLGPWGCTLTNRVAALPAFIDVPKFAAYLTPFWTTGTMTVEWYAGATLMGATAVTTGGARIPVPGGGATRVQFTGPALSALAVWSLAL